MRREKVIQAYSGDNQSFVLVQSGLLYSMGYNEYGELGLGDNQNRSIPCMIDSKRFNHEKIIQISVGYYHSMALTQYGNVYTWGYESNGALGLGIQTDDDVPQKIGSNHFFNEPVRYISTGVNGSSFAVTKNNKVFSWGYNLFGQLALGNDTNQFTPQLININSYNNEKVLKISCGNCHTLLLTENGNIYSCGYNIHGDLGLGHNTSTNTFQSIDLNRFGNEKVKDIEAGYFSLAITESGALYSWGYNNCGQLGLNDRKNRNSPHLIDVSHFKNEKVVKIACGSVHSFAMTHSGKIYLWGDNRERQLGLGHSNQVSKPTEMNQQQYFKDETVVSLSGSWVRAFYGEGHSFAITQTGKLFTWGYNAYGQLGLNHYKYMSEPQLCCPYLFGLGLKSDKLYENQSFSDLVIEFD